jgi:hypothetical protein
MIVLVGLIGIVHELGQDIRAIENLKLFFLSRLCLALFPFLGFLKLPLFSLLLFLTLLERLWSAAGHTLLLYDLISDLGNTLQAIPITLYVPHLDSDSSPFEPPALRQAPEGGWYKDQEALT